METLQNRSATPLEHFPLSALNVGNSRSAVRDRIDHVAVTRNSLLAELTGRDLAQLSPRFQLVQFEAGETVYSSDHLIESVFFPLTAVASRLSILEDGSTVEVGLIGRDGVIGLSALIGTGRTKNWTVIDIGGSAIRLRAAALREALNRMPSLASALSLYYQNFFSQVTHRAVCRSRHTIVAQLSTWLLMVHDRVDRSDLPLTQENIARRLGSRRAGITVAANILKKAGAIAYSRGHISVADRTKLSEFACECYEAPADNLRIDAPMASKLLWLHQSTAA
jgi:CRP-like cAMP-binding protein